MSSQHFNHTLKSSPTTLNDETDILNDSISLDINDDSFDGNESTFIIPSQSQQLSGPSTSTHFNEALKRAEDSRPGTSFSSGKKQLHGKGGEELEEEINEEGNDDQPHGRPIPRTVNQSNRRQSRRDQELENERDWLREINQLLERSADEMDKNVQLATETSHELLDLYSKILTQTEHTKDLISNPDWHGLTQDVRGRAELEERERIKRQEEREKEREEELKRERMRREKEEELRLEESERVRKLNQSQRLTRNQIPTTTSTSRGRTRIASTTNNTAGRNANRGSSRITRFNP